MYNFACYFVAGATCSFVLREECRLRVSRFACWGRCLGLKCWKLQAAGENCVNRSFVFCTDCEMLCVWAVKGG